MIKQWNLQYEDYLHDESLRIGSAQSISFPLSEADIIDIIKKIGADGGRITTQGARTGIAAGAVPDGGHILNLSRMNAIGEIRQDESGEHSIIVEPGALLSDVKKIVEKDELFFPPDPTETSASIGGMVSCNASGAMSFFYGSTRNWVKSIRVVLADGSIANLKRGENVSQARSFALTTQNGKTISGNLPTYIMPSVKSAAGYYTSDNVDIIDLFIGAEGTLGIITQIELKLIEKPKAIVGLSVFFSSEDAALKFVRVMRAEEVGGLDRVDVRPVAIEFFNSDALNLLRTMKSNNPAFANIPALKPHFHSAIYVEFHGVSDEELEETVMQVMNAILALGASDDDTWFGTTERELEPMKAFRHATPEAVNLLIGERKRSNPEITKLGTDMSVPDAYLEMVMAMYNNDLREQSLDSVIFGHIGNNHVHVNILPNDMRQYEIGKSLYLSWARQIVALGGSVSAEHGIGKLKVPFLELMYGEEGIAQMRQLKKILDPNSILNPGNLF